MDVPETVDRRSFQAINLKQNPTLQTSPKLPKLQNCQIAKMHPNTFLAFVDQPVATNCQNVHRGVQSDN